MTYVSKRRIVHCNSIQEVMLANKVQTAKYNYSYETKNYKVSTNWLVQQSNVYLLFSFVSIFPYIWHYAVYNA